MLTPLDGIRISKTNDRLLLINRFSRLKTFYQSSDRVGTGFHMFQKQPIKNTSKHCKKQTISSCNIPISERRLHQTNFIGFRKTFRKPMKLYLFSQRIFRGIVYLRLLITSYIFLIKNTYTYLYSFNKCIVVWYTNVQMVSNVQCSKDSIFFCK